MINNRSINRFDLELPMVIKGIDIMGHSFEESTTSINISSRGACCLVENRIKNKTDIHTMVTIPNKSRNRVSVKGKVVWVKEEIIDGIQKTGIGICFNLTAFIP